MVRCVQEPRFGADPVERFQQSGVANFGDRMGLGERAVKGDHDRFPGVAGLLGDELE